MLCSVVEDNYDLMAESGFTKPPTCLTMSDNVSVVQSVALHQVILKTFGELEQFRDGLETLEVAGAMKRYSCLSRFFINEKTETHCWYVAINNYLKLI